MFNLSKTNAENLHKKEEFIDFLDESPSRKFTTTQIVNEFSVSKVTVHTWAEELLRYGLIRREKIGCHWVFYSKNKFEKNSLRPEPGIALPRVATHNAKNLQNWSAVSERLRVDPSFITLGNAVDVSPFWSARC